MKYGFIILCLICLKAKAQTTIDSAKQKLLIDTLNMVDWSFNNDYYFLTTDKGIKASVGLKVFKKVSHKYSSEITILDRKGNFLFIRTFLLGNLQVLAFDVGNPKWMMSGGQKHPSKFKSFITNRGIFLGMKLEAFLKHSKKISYEVSEDNGAKVYSFTSQSLPKLLLTNTILKYEAKYYFEQGKLVKYYFGLF